MCSHGLLQLYPLDFRNLGQMLELEKVFRLLTVLLLRWFESSFS